MGILTVVDRLIRQAMHQVLMLLFHAGFSQSLMGGSAHDAVLAARARVAAGPPPSSPNSACRSSSDCPATSIALDEPPYTEPYVLWCGRRGRGFLLT
ncbi:hypothetical protein IVB16_32410 [Bradyrhizobium sp. 183]|nr:hypothetical protein IVB16_32410 [Bradyrhizobium sp. 183]